MFTGLGFRAILGCLKQAAIVCVCVCVCVCVRVLLPWLTPVLGFVGV